jgi:hypothetical protein
MKTSTNPTAVTKPMTFIHKIGSTTYKVNAHFSTTNTESLDDKIFANHQK